MVERIASDMAVPEGQSDAGDQRQVKEKDRHLVLAGLDRLRDSFLAWRCYFPPLPNSRSSESSIRMPAAWSSSSFCSP